jgi:hypothetical protein
MGRAGTFIAKATVAAGTLAVVLVVLVFIARLSPLQTLFEQEEPPPESPAAAVDPGYLFGRVTMGSGAIYEGRLRWGGDQEAFWGDYFNGVKLDNPWAALLPPEQLRKESRPISIFGIELMKRDEEIDVGRQFMARFGDITRIEGIGRIVRVTLKSGTVVDLDYFESHDLADGVRVWDSSHGVTDLGQGDLDFGPRAISTIDLLPAPPSGAAATRLHGAVRARHGSFTGFIQWNRKEGSGADELKGHTADGDVRLPFDTIASITRQSNSTSLVKLLDGREIVLTDSREAGEHLGIYVDDRRYGRVLISWDAFEGLEFSSGGHSPAYTDFPAGSPLIGSVTTRMGRQSVGRLVYDLDESETTETLDISSQGVTYNIPFGMIASIGFPNPGVDGAGRVKVTLHNGEALEVDRAGDVGEGNAGMLIFIGGSKQPEYVRWPEIQQIRFDRPPAMYPP